MASDPGQDAPVGHDGTRTTILLALVAAAGLAVTVWLLIVLQASGRHLRTPEAPRGMLSLQVAGDLRPACGIVDSWRNKPVLPGDRTALNHARRSLALDEGLLLAYAVTLLLSGTLAVRYLGFSRERLRTVLLGLATLCAGAALFDHLENGQLARLVGSDATVCRQGVEGEAARRALLYAQMKYAFLLVLGTGMLTAAGAAVRIKFSGRGGEDESLSGGFRELCVEEGLDPTGVREGPAREPWLRYSVSNKVGLALSGGGIRSATFNLGLLQGLHDLGFIGYFDYLSTVSGGGYIGGWWTAWRTRDRANDPGPFPRSQVPPEDRAQPKAPTQEPPEIRHLREFSNFLTPRWGFFESEMWNAFVAILGGMLPALLVAASLMCLALFVWLFLAFHIVWRSTWIPPAVIVSMAALVFILAEREWKTRGKGDDERIADSTYRVAAAVSVVLLVLLWLAWRGVLIHFGSEAPLWSDGRWVSSPAEPLHSWWRAIGASPGHRGIQFSPRLFDPAIVCLAAVLGLLVPRVLGSSFGKDEWRRAFVTGIDRVVQRLLALALGWSLVALTWSIGSNLHRVDYAALVAGGGAAGSAGLFALLRDWIGQKLAGSKRGGVMEALKPYIPTTLAYLALLLGGALLASGMVLALGDSWWAWLLAATSVATLLGLSLFLDLSEVGLHAFYRDRIVRAYLGASNPDAGRTASRNRQTEPRRNDDPRLADTLRRGPIHLICCAANDLAGDHLENLARGSRSAVLSGHGIAIGNHWTRNTDLLMGPCLTASAAAVNSNMGSISMSLGPPVAFLMSAMNIRLGLWLRHPGHKGRARRACPGLPFIREMFGWTMSGTRNDGRPVSSDVHLSDGAHFENLALYELVRRHCRYIIVSDCGADPDVAFDDFGNAARRIREDFGVEIEIDLSPLCPGEDRQSRQHMAVGMIHYDGTTGGDKGILLYYKPTLTGDEPRDILQYRERNKAFPHETTGDQFYDEAQWESYRRLGEHAARESLRFASREEIGDAAGVFIGARREWSLAPSDLGEKLLELTGRYAELESEIRESAPAGFAVEIFPELELLYQPACAPTDAWLEQRTKIHLLMKMIQLMEEVWFGCHLDTHYNHPLNLGWLNLFQRWAWTPSFRMWWPFLSPMYGTGFRRFAREQFELAGSGPGAPERRLKCLGRALPGGLAWRWWSDRMGWRPPAGDLLFFTYSFVLRPPAAETIDVEVGIGALTIKGTTAEWTSEGFFVPPSLWGSGIGGSFLRELIAHLRVPAPGCHPRVTKCRVELVPKRETGRTGRGSRQEFADLVAFYESAGFSLVKNPQGRHIVEI